MVKPTKMWISTGDDFFSTQLRRRDSAEWEDKLQMSDERHVNNHRINRATLLQPWKRYGLYNMAAKVSVHTDMVKSGPNCFQD